MTSLLRVLLAALVLTGCASAPPPAPVPASPIAADWQPVLLPGKRATVYLPETKDGRPAIAARADGSASLWRRRVRVAPTDLGEVEFSWWVRELLPDANMLTMQRSDTPARVVFAFAGDRSRLSLRNRSLFDLAEMMTGESPPYATLMYVWDPAAPVGTVIVSERSDRIRKIVVESGHANLGQWRQYRRNLVEDYKRVFAEDPGALVSIAVFTDADNTESHAEAWYGDIKLH